MQQKITQAALDALTQGAYKEMIKESASLQAILINIKNEIDMVDNLKLVSVQEHTNQKNAQRFLKHLNKRYYSSYEKLNNQDMKNKNLIIQSVTKLYFLTEEYFVALGLVTKPNFRLTGIVDNMYIQLDINDVDLLNQSTDLLGLAQSSKSEGAGLKFNTSKVIEKLKDSIKQDQDKIDYAKKLYAHYNRFSLPFQRAENKGSKINQGVVREAFERHLENLHRSAGIGPYDFQECKMESVGQRWVLYRQSSGSDPYFTGPDTEGSQIKAENASLVGNIDTVLNTARFILLEAEGKINISQEQIKAALEVKSLDQINTFSEKLWNNLSKTAQDIVRKSFGTKTGNGVHIKLT